jgi:hypothetical protein
MTDFRALLKTHGTPLPNAVTMETEVRSEGALTFRKLEVPGWAEKLTSSSMLSEWSCELDAESIIKLQSAAKKLYGGKPAEQVINEALAAAGIGSYLGTFIEEGLMVAGGGTIRVLFAYRSAKLDSIGAINAALHDLLTADPLSDGATALLELRRIWEAGRNRSEGGLMLLSQLNLYDPERSPFTGIRFK